MADTKQVDLARLRDELLRHCEFVMDGKFIEFKGYYRTKHPDTDEIFAAAKVSETLVLAEFLKGDE